MVDGLRRIRSGGTGPRGTISSMAKSLLMPDREALQPRHVARQAVRLPGARTARPDRGGQRGVGAGGGAGSRGTTEAARLAPAGCAFLRPGSGKVDRGGHGTST